MAYRGDAFFGKPRAASLVFKILASLRHILVMGYETPEPLTEIAE